MRCKCGRRFRMLPLPDGQPGHITGCPKCLSTEEAKKAMQALIDAARKQYAEKSVTRRPVASEKGEPNG